ncbi:MAG: HypC/HybG/HupF family hydrogenase formation chaperone [Burkholderiaceae bacterium]
MCIGIPMQVSARRPGFATVRGRGEQREVATALVGEPAVGDWLLVFLDGAREAISAARAAEVDATLDLLQAALAGDATGADASFTLPSAASAEQLRAWTGQA